MNKQTLEIALKAMKFQQHYEEETINLLSRKIVRHKEAKQNKRENALKAHKYREETITIMKRLEALKKALSEVENELNK